MGVTKNEGRPVLLPYKEKVRRTQEKREDKKMTTERAREILGTDFFGPEAVEKTFGFTPENIPDIQFSENDLERAKELGQFLILRADQTTNGKPLTMQEMNKMLEAKLKKAKKGKILWSVDWYANEDFYTKDTPKLSWALVSKTEIPGSTSKNHLQQTEQMVEYLMNQVFKDVDPDKIPQEYTEAIEELNAQKAEIAQLIKDNWQEAALRLSNLKINKLLRQLPVEAIYDWLVYLENNNVRLMEGKYTWTHRRDSSGRLVSVGYFASAGASVSHWTPDAVDGALGVSFSRSR